MASAFAEGAAAVGESPVPRTPPAWSALFQMSFRQARISELLQIHGVDPLTVAAQCGTSLAMAEKTRAGERCA